MDRRAFFKTLMVTPFFTPLLLSVESKKAPLQLYVISDSPHLFVPLILEGLDDADLIPGRTFAFLNLQPEENDLHKALSVRGWRRVSRTSGADLYFSFNPIRQKIRPSFTLLKEGRIWDIRSRRLYPLWKEMQSHHAPSSWLTTVSINHTPKRNITGSHATVYIEGKCAENLSLKKNSARSFRTANGQIKIIVDNGQAFVSDSSCPNKICLSSFPAYRAGDRIICAPNHFMLEVHGPSGPDTVIG